MSGKLAPEKAFLDGDAQHEQYDQNDRLQPAGRDHLPALLLVPDERHGEGVRMPTWMIQNPAMERARPNDETQPNEDELPGNRGDQRDGHALVGPRHFLELPAAAFGGRGW